MSGRDQIVRDGALDQGRANLFLETDYFIHHNASNAWTIDRSLKIVLLTCLGVGEDWGSSVTVKLRSSRAFSAMNLALKTNRLWVAVIGKFLKVPGTTIRLVLLLILVK